MSGLHAVKTLKDHVVVPGHGLVDVAQTTVQIDEASFDTIPAGAFSGGSPTLQDMGPIADPADEVSNQAAFVAQPAAVTSAQVATANANTQTASYVQADVQSIATLANALKVQGNAAQADIVALQGKVAALMTALKVANGPMAAS